jgi:hypothetical protein
MLEGVLWLFDDPLSDLLLAGIFVLAALHHRQMRLLQRRTDQLAFRVSELNALIRTTSPVTDGPTLTQRGPSMRFDETTLAT